MYIEKSPLKNYCFRKEKKKLTKKKKEKKKSGKKEEKQRKKNFKELGRLVGQLGIDKLTILK